MIRYHYITLFLLILSTTVKAQNIEFIENKGQWDDHVKFRSEVPAGSFFIRNGGFTVLQHNKEDLKQVFENIHGQQGDDQNKRSSPLILHSHSYAVDFAGASDKIEMVPDKPLPTYNNYFIGNDPSRWASNCKIYQGVTAKNIYPGVDVRFYTDKGNMKYDIIVKPGADASKIVLRYSGADNLEVRDKQLVIKTSVGDVKEMDPYTYQYENNQRKHISAKYVLIGKEIRFDVKNYNHNETLIIDPTLIFSSFSGSTGDNWGFTATYGPDGSFFGGGINFSSGYPVTPGAFQTVWVGGGSSGVDISISKLSPNGSVRMYATYIGGSDNEQPHSLVVDGAGNLIVAGRSHSSNYPVYPATGSNIGTGGSFDIVVTKLNPTGTQLIGSKKIGGTGDDGVNIKVEGFESLQQNYGDNGRSEVIVDGGGNIYVASCTQSSGSPNSGGFPATPGSFQTSSGGAQDAVVLKFDPAVNLSFASYLGGLGNDAAYVLSLAPNGSIYVGGGTASKNFPGNMAGTIHSANQGGTDGIDGFVAVITNNGSAIVRSTYLGTSGVDQVYGLQFDKFGFPYVCGQTGGNWPVINAAYSVAGAPQFIAKLEPDLSAFIYSTRFGKLSLSGVPNISITAFLVDNCENVYVSGWGGVIDSHFPSTLTTGLPVTPDAIKSTTDGRDFYFFVLKKNATAQLFGSFWGQNLGLADHVDGGTSRFDKQGVIYQAICANCGGAVTYPTTSPVVGPGPINPAAVANNGAGCNLAMLKISFDFAGVDAGLQAMINGVPRDTVGCAPLTVDFIDTVANAVTYYWYFGDGSLPNPVITTVPNTSHTYNLPGFYQVMLISEDSTTCNIRDTAYVHIKVGNLPAFLDFDPFKLDPCDSLKYRFDNLSSSTRPFTNTSFIWDFGDNSPTVIAGSAPVFHHYTSPGTYTVKLTLIDTAYCNAPETLTKVMRIAPLVVAQFETPPTGCAPYTAQFKNTTIAGQTFLWDFGDNTTSTSTDPVHLYNTPGPYTITLIANDPNTCNLSDTTTFTINVFPIPVSNFTFAPDPPVENTPTSFNNLASPDAVKFKWLFGDGDSLITTSRSQVKHQYNATGTYNACLIAINSAGCADTLCQPVSALVFALVDVPNAFTPQRGDVNSVVFVRGFGITKIRFIIWNRWGQKVFETNDKNIGWDGKYKGVIQPVDVYAYTLDVEFFDGKKTTKKGDITLIR